MITEGKNTEPNYIRYFAKVFGNGLVAVEIVDAAGVPATLVAIAKKAKRAAEKSSNSFDKLDRVWTVFDCDEHPLIPDSMQQARDADVGVAYSNPCFEVWLLLHLRELDAPLDRFATQALLASLDNNYRPHGSKSASLENMAQSYPAAKVRATQMRERRIMENDPLGRPYTNVDELLDEIAALGNASLR